MRNEINRKINKLPMNYFDKKTNGEVLSIITNDIDIAIFDKTGTLTTGKFLDYKIKLKRWKK